MAKENSTSPLSRPEHSCTCSECQDMCKRVPCFPTPQDAKRIIDAGFGDKLTLSLHASIYPKKKMYPLLAPNIKTENNHCVFFNDGLCDLHPLGLKPTEGKLASHDTIDSGLRVAVCLTWYSKSGTRMLEYFVKQEELKNKKSEIVPCYEEEPTHNF